MVHPFVEFWRSRSGSPHRVLLPAWVGLWLLFGLMSAPWRNVVLYQKEWTLAPALLLLMVGLRIYFASGSDFSFMHLSGLPEMREGSGRHALITSGLRNRVRHPIYLGHLCEMLAWSLGSGLLISYVLTAFAVVTGAFMIHLEDQELERRFGEPYRIYRAAVPTIFPKI